MQKLNKLHYIHTVGYHAATKSFVEEHQMLIYYKNILYNNYQFICVQKKILEECLLNYEQ